MQVPGNTPAASLCDTGKMLELLQNYCPQASGSAADEDTEDKKDKDEGVPKGRLLESSFHNLSFGFVVAGLAQHCAAGQFPLQQLLDKLKTAAHVPADQLHMGQLQAPAKAAAVQLSEVPVPPGTDDA